MKVPIAKYLVLSVLIVGLYNLIPNAVRAQENEIEITTNSNQAQDLFLEGRSQFEKNHFDEARNLFKQAVKADPEFAIAHLYLALVSPNANQFYKNLQIAVTNRAKVSEGEQLMIDAVQAYANNKPNKSIEIWEEIVQRYPNDKRAHQYLATAYLNVKDNDLAIEQLDKAINLDNEFVPAYNLLGYAYKANGDFENAEKAFQKYIDLLPEEANPHDSIADLYTKLGEHEKAITHYKEALKLNPKVYYSQQKIGTNLIFLGKYEEGRKAYQRASKVTSNGADRVHHMKLIAQSYLYEGKYDKALNAYDQALQMSKEEKLPELTASIYSDKCDIYIERGDLEKAKRNAERCGTDMQASDLPEPVKNYYAKKVLFHEAIIAAKSKNFERAMKFADKYHDDILGDENPLDMENYHALVGYINFEKGDYESALTDFHHANQDNPHVVYHMAMAYANIGNDEAASEYFDQVANWNEPSIEYALVRTKAKNSNHKIMKK